MTQSDNSERNHPANNNPFGNRPQASGDPPAHFAPQQVPPQHSTQPGRNQFGVNQPSGMQPSVNQPSGMQPTQPPGATYTDHTGAHVRPASSGVKTAIIVAVTVVTVIGFCGGGMGLMVYSFTKASRASEEFKENRMAANAPPSREITQNLVEPRPFEVSETVPNPLSKSEAAELRTFVDELIEVANAESGEELIDMNRLVIEIENSGLAVGVNGWTRAIWKQNLEGAQSLPWLSSDVTEIIGFEWLEPQIDARLTLATFWDGDENPQIWYFYLTRRRDEWKVYDFREVISPCSEAQYWAVYTKASEPLDVAYANMAQEVDDIYYSEQPPAAKAREMFAAYTRYSYPSIHRGLAQKFLAEYLILLEADDQLEQLVAQMNPQQMLCGHYYAGLVALAKERNRKAFERAELMMQKLPWHPTAGILAAKAATSEEEKEKAAEWLMTTMKLTLKHDLSSAYFFSVATPEQQRRLFTELASYPDANREVAEMIGEIEYAGVPVDRESILETMASVPQLANAVRFTRLSFASEKEDTDGVVEYGMELLRSEGGHEILDNLPYDWVRQAIVGSLVRQGKTDLLPEVQPDVEKLLELIAYATAGNVELEWQALNDFLEQYDASELSPQPANSLAAAQTRCLLGLNRPDEALTRLLPLLDDPDFIAEEPDPTMRSLLAVAMEVASKAGKPNVLVESLPEGQYLMPAIANFLSGEKEFDDLAQFLDWQSSEYPEMDSPWLDYYRGQAAFAQGDWTQADKLFESVSVAMQEAGEEGLDVSQVPPLYLENYDQYLLESMAWERLDAAIRAGKPAQLVENLIARGQLDESWLENVRYYVEDLSNSSDADRIARLLMEFSNPEAKAIGHRLRAYQLQSTGDLDGAFKQLLTATQLFREKQNVHSRNQATASSPESDTDISDLVSEMLENGAMDSDFGSDVEEQTEDNPYFYEAASMACTYRRPDFLKQLRPLANATPERLQLDAIRALLNGAAPQLIASIKAADDAAEYGNDFNTNSQIMLAAKDLKVWPKVTEEQTPDFGYLQYGLPTVEGALFLSRSASEFESEVIKSLTDSVQAFEKQLDASVKGDAVQFKETVANLEQVVFAYQAETKNACYYAIGYDGLPATVSDDSDFGRQVQDRNAASGCVVFAILHKHGLSPVKEMRSAFVELSGVLGESATLFRDDVTHVWFYGTEWANELRKSLETGVPADRPVADYPYRGEGAGELLTEDDGQRYLNLQACFSVERVPVTVLDENDLYETKIELQVESTLYPFLVKGTYLIVDQSY